MSANRENKDIKESKEFHALLLPHTPTAFCVHNCQGTGPAARFRDTPHCRGGVLGLADPCPPGEAIIPAFVQVWSENATQAACLVMRLGAQLVGCYYLVSGSPHATRGEAAVV
jgi:hypothetical protein